MGFNSGFKGLNPVMLVGVKFTRKLLASFKHAGLNFEGQCVIHKEFG